MLEGFFYGQKKLPIILFSYIVPIRKDNKKMTRKHFKELAKILNENNASKQLVKDVILFWQFTLEAIEELDIVANQNLCVEMVL